MKTKTALATACVVVVLLNSCKKEAVNQVAVNASGVSNMYTETALTVQLPVTHKVDTNIGGYLEALPAHYSDHPNKRYPVIFFLNGSGSLGDGSKTSLLVEDNIAIPHLIQKGDFPSNFIVNGFTYQFIVITPQFKYWPQPSDVSDMINYAISNYRIDTSRMYVCGLSMGGGTTWEYAAAYGKRIAAIVPICGASAPTVQKGKSIAEDSLAVWAFHNTGDPTVPSWYSIDYVQYINSYNPFIPAKLTLTVANVHAAWGKATNPDYKENNMNIYEWMLTYKRKRR